MHLTLNIEIDHPNEEFRKMYVKAVRDWLLENVPEMLRDEALSIVFTKTDVDCVETRNASRFKRRWRLSSAGPAKPITPTSGNT